MIKFGPVGLELSLEVVRALLSCTEENNQKPWLSVGIDKGDVCATDGITLVRFQRVEVDPNGRRPEEWSGRFWMRSYVELQLKAAGRKGPVLLAWETLAEGKFPLAHKAEPSAGAEPIKEPVGFDARCMARLELVARACRRERLPGENPAEPLPLPAVALTSIMGPLDPMRFAIAEDGWNVAHTAFFTIMPMKLRSYVEPKRKPRAKKVRAA